MFFQVFLAIDIIIVIVQTDGCLAAVFEDNLKPN